MAEYNELGPIQGERYIQNVGIGLWYDLNPIRPQKFTDTGQLNAEVDRIRPLIHKGGFEYLPTLCLLEKQWAEMSNDWREILASKTHVLLYKSGWSPSQAWPTLDEHGEVDIVCVPTGSGGEATWPCWTKWDDNAFGFRFIKVDEPVIVPPVVPPVDGGGDPVIPPVIPGDAKAVIHLCPHCGGKLIL